MKTRIESLCELTNGQPSWYSTHAKITATESRLGLSWDGNLCQHVAKIGKLVLTASGKKAIQYGQKIVLAD